MRKTKVSIVKTGPQPEYHKIRAAVEDALNLIDGVQDIIKPGDLVLINPSWVAPPVEREAGCITIPEVPRAFGGYCKRDGGPAGDCRIIGDRCGFGQSHSTVGLPGPD